MKTKSILLLIGSFFIPFIVMSQIGLSASIEGAVPVDFGHEHNLNTGFSAMLHYKNAGVKVMSLYGDTDMIIWELGYRQYDNKASLSGLYMEGIVAVQKSFDEEIKFYSYGFGGGVGYLFKNGLDIKGSVKWLFSNSRKNKDAPDAPLSLSLFNLSAGITLFKNCD